jgi:DNA-binding transcriptional LysR family regulator
MGHGRRQLLWFAVTRHPTAEWLAKQIVEAFPCRLKPATLQYSVAYLHSDMLTAISADQLWNEIASGDLIVLPIDLGKTRRSIGIAQRRGALPSPGTRALLDEIRMQVYRMIKEGQLLPVTRPIL